MSAADVVAGLGIEAVRTAARVLADRVLCTPVLRCPVLDEIAGVELWLKAENMQHGGAFKARGAEYAVAALAPAERARGLVTYSSGNHGQAVALAARRHSVPAYVAMPVDAPAVKVAAVRALGAEVVFAGTTSTERFEAALALRERTGAVIVPPFDHPHVIAGQGTATLELCEQVAAATGGGRLDALLVPVGGGGLIAGACLVAAEQGVRVLGVEPEGCDALARSLAAGRRVTVAPAATLADGLKPVRVGELCFAIARCSVSRVLCVTDEQIGRAFSSLLLLGHTLVEPSGAAALGAVLRGGLESEGRRVGVLLSGGNVDAERISSLLRSYPPYARK